MWSLLGVIRVDVSSGRLIAGNKLLPYMLVTSFENLECKGFTYLFIYFMSWVIRDKVLRINLIRHALLSLILFHANPGSIGWFRLGFG